MSMSKIIVLSLVCVSCATAQDAKETVAKSKAILALTKAARERGEQERVIATGCFDDEATAKKLAEKLGKKLILWVGMKCEDVPSIRKDLSDCVHCHTESHNGDTTPRVVVTGLDGKEYRVERPDLSTAAVRHIWGEQ